MTAAGIRKSRCFLFDLDGTIYLGGQLLPGVEELLAYLDERGTAYYFITNNSSRSRLDYVKKLENFGLQINEQQVFSSGMATAIHIKKHSPSARIYLVGTPALEEEFKNYGLELVDQDPDYAVLGFDTTLTYEKIRKLADYIREGIPYLATHPDLNCPTPEGFIPDIGSMMAMVEASTGKKADLIIGKPHQPMVEAIAELTGFPTSKITMVGDRLYTDIALGEAGLQTVLVLTGEAVREDLPGAPHQPDLVCRDLVELREILKGSGE